MTTFIATLGNDTFTGSAASDDTVDYSRTTSADEGVFVNLTTGGSQETYGSGTDTFTSIEGLIGTGYRDVIRIAGTANYHLSLGGGDDEILSDSGLGAWTLDGGDGIDYWGANLDGMTTNVAFIYDSLTQTGTLTGGTTLKNIENIGINFGAGNDTITITNGIGHVGDWGTTLTGGYGADTFIIDGFQGLNNYVSGGTNTPNMAADNDSLILDLSKSDTTAHTSFISESYNSFRLEIIGSGAFSADGFEHLNYTADNSDNRIVVNSLPEFTGSVSLHVDAAGGTDGLEMNLAVLGQDVQNVVWTITGDVTTSSNIGIYDHFETIDLTLGGGNNVLNMGNEIDTIYSEAGHDVINAGGGDDTLQAHFYNHTALSVTYHGGTGDDTLSGGAVDDYLYGDADDDYIDGGAGNDVINGGTGADVLIGGLGTDTLSGGTGDDIYYLDDFHDVVTELRNGGNDTVYSSVQYIMGGSYVENAILTGTLNSYAVGNALDNQLTGNSGNNNLTGGGGSDRLDGGAGADGLRGGIGNDTYYVDNLGDFIVENKDEGTDLVFSSVNFNLGAQYIENLTLTGTASINGSGNALINTITGNAGNNILDGRQGADMMSGGAGNDTYYVDNLGDKVIEANGQGTDTVISSVTFAMGGQYIDNLTLTGTGKINGSGNALANTIIGNAGNNTLDGRQGNDTLTGGGGADIFFFGAGSGKDVITDFSASQNDSLNLHAYSEATAVITQVGNDTVIDLGGGNIVTLTGTLKADVVSHIAW